MIFVTVGAQMPFDRLVATVDQWAIANDRDDVVAQIGNSELKPRAMTCTPFMDPAEFRQHLCDADAVVTHAGMGTILSCLELGKPVLVMPRRGDLQETRNDHQIATARAFAKARRISVAWDEEEMRTALDHLTDLPAPHRVPSHASPRLISALRSFIEGDTSVETPRQSNASPPSKQRDRTHDRRYRDAA